MSEAVYMELGINGGCLEFNSNTGELSCFEESGDAATVFLTLPKARELAAVLLAYIGDA